MALSPQTVASQYTAALTSPQAASELELATLFAPRVTVWHCWDERPLELPAAALAAAMTRKLRLCQERLTDYRNTVTLLHVAPAGITVGVLAQGHYPDGAPLYISRCVVLGLSAAGLIQRVDNYGDHSKSTELDRVVPHKEILKTLPTGQ